MYRGKFPIEEKREGKPELGRFLREVNWKGGGGREVSSKFYSAGEILFYDWGGEGAKPPGTNLIGR